MVNFQDPLVVAQDILVVAKFWSAVDGLYLWEFITTLDYEWSIIRGHRTHSWTIWIYSTTRLATLITVILNLCAISVTRRRFNCQVEVLFQLIFGYIAVASASLLIVLRILAIWNKKRIVVAIASGTWMVSVIFSIQSIARIRAGWDPIMEDVCELLNLSVTKPYTLVVVITNIILLVIMFIGLLSNRLYESGMHSIGRLLWKQGLIWLLIATTAEILPAVFICLNLNNPLNYIFQLPSMITISIAATRIHRSLTDFAATVSYNLPSALENSPRAVSVLDRACSTVAPMPLTVPLNHMEVAVHKTYRRYRDSDEMGGPASNSMANLCSAEGRALALVRPTHDRVLELRPVSAPQPTFGHS